MATNSLTSTGLTIEQLSDIISDLTTGYISIYGADINLESNTPDGQMMNIYATALEDNLELLQVVYNSFSLTNAFGVQVDNLVALNGIQRQNGTYTIAYVEITVAQALTLTGMDALTSNPNASVFQLSDNTGNVYQLQTTYSFSGTGTVSLAFQAQNIGQTLTTANTITTILTPITGVTSANNPTTANDIIGTNEETDIQVKVRQANSFQLAATGPADTLRAQLLNTAGVIDAFVPENDANSVVNGLPPNGIWTIVNAPSVADSVIAQVIYSKKPAGCAQLFTTTQNGTTTSGAATITGLSSTSGMVAGMVVSGTGIPSGSIISAVNSATEITINNNATSSGTVSVTVATNSYVASAVSYNITRPAGNIFTAWWSNAVSQPLYISFQILPINGVDQFNTTTLATSLAAALTYRLNQSAFIGDVIRAMQTIAPNGYLQNVYVGASSSPSSQTVAPSALINYFTVSSSDISITT